MTKPVVYNYQKAEERIAELEAENIRLKEELAELRKAVNNELEAEKNEIQALLDKWGPRLP